MMSTKENTQERKAFKDWFDQSAAQALATQISGVLPNFDQINFVRLATGHLDKLEFNGRVQQFSDALAATLPPSVPKALTILTKSLPDPLPHCEAVTDGWLQWPLGQFIADHGLEHVDASMKTMIALTKRFSAEFAVRPFVEHYPKEVFKRLLVLTQDANPHVRRWCSEGVRPRLPWGKKLHALVKDPSPIWPILEALKDDEELYVRRSVANNLNDIAKDHPEFVIKRCKTWKKTSNKRRDWVIQHALRSLIKAGNPDALAIVGYTSPKQLQATLSIHPKKIARGQEVAFTAQLQTTSAQAQDLMIDYMIHYVRKNGNTSSKVFKWKTVRLPARHKATMQKRHSLKKTTVRALYPGIHNVELQVNGVRIAKAYFHLT